MWAVPFTADPIAAYFGAVVLITVLLVVCHLRDGVPGRELGVRIDNALPALRVYALPFGIAIALMLSVGSFAGTLHFGGKFFGMLAAVPMWALLQQYMLLAFAHRRFRNIFGPGPTSVAATASLFALMHLPNPTLTVVCGAAGIVWAWQYERSPNLFANAFTHTLASAFLANSLPHTVLKNMVVGYNYFLR
jgi:membrane protease YdiL (CAAX protease family)